MYLYLQADWPLLGLVDSSLGYPQNASISYAHGIRIKVFMRLEELKEPSVKSIPGEKGYEW